MLDKKNYLTIGEASEYLGVSIDTLRRWEKKGRITPFRSPGGHRYYEQQELDNLFGRRYTRDMQQVDSIYRQSLSHNPVVTQPDPIPLPSLPLNQGTTETKGNSTAHDKNEAPQEVDNIFGASDIVTTRSATPVISDFMNIPEKNHIPHAIQVRPIEPIRITHRTYEEEKVVNEKNETVTIETMQRIEVTEVTAPPQTHPITNTPPLLIPQVALQKTQPDVTLPKDPHDHTSAKSNKKELTSTIIIISILLLVIVLGAILFIMLWQSSQSVLSPTP